MIIVKEVKEWWSVAMFILADMAKTIWSIMIQKSTNTLKTRAQQERNGCVLWLDNLVSSWVDSFGRWGLDDCLKLWSLVWSEGSRSSFTGHELEQCSKRAAAGEEVARVMKAIKLGGDPPLCHSLGNLALFFNPFGIQIENFEALEVGDSSHCCCRLQYFSVMWILKGRRF